MDGYVGVDVHQGSCHGTVQDKGGEIIEQGYFKNSPPGYEDFFEGIEEAGGPWQPVYDWLDEKYL